MCVCCRTFSIHYNTFGSRRVAGVALGLETPDQGLAVLRAVDRLFYRVRVGRLLRALRGGYPAAALLTLHLPHGRQRQNHGLDGHLEVLVSHVKI